MSLFMRSYRGAMRANIACTRLAFSCGWTGVVIVGRLPVRSWQAPHAVSARPELGAVQ
jgi:hypothetical protein